MDPSFRARTPVPNRRSFAVDIVARRPEVPAPAPVRLQVQPPVVPRQPLAIDSFVSQPQPAPAPLVPPSPAPVASQPVQPVPATVSQLITRETVAIAQAIPPPVAAARPKPFLKRKKLLLSLAIVVAILVIGAGSAAAYFAMVVPNKPDNVLLQALANSLQANASQSFKGLVTSNNFQASLSGAAATSGNFHLSADMTYLGSSLHADALSPDGSQAYGRITGASQLLANKRLATDPGQAFVLGLLSQYAPAIQTMNGQWYQMPLTKHSLSATDIAMLSKLYQQSPLLKIMSTYKAETINGTPSYRYSVAIDGNNLQSFLVSLNDAHIPGLLINQDQLSLINDNLGTINFSRYPLTIWISQDKKLINQLSFAGTNLKATLTLSDFGKPVSAQPPAKSVPFTGLRSQLQNLNASGADDGSTIGIEALLVNLII